MLSNSPLFKVLKNIATEKRKKLMLVPVLITRYTDIDQRKKAARKDTNEHILYANL